MPQYLFEIGGVTGDDVPFLVTGRIHTQQQGDFALVPSAVMVEAFQALTEGKAVYGKPGVHCKGPYRMNRMLIEELLS